MNYLSTLQGMSLEQIQAVIEIMQMSSDAYMFILDLTADTYMMAEKATKRFPFPATVIENCTDTFKDIVYPSDYDMLAAELEKCRSGEKDDHAMEYRWLDRMNRVVWISCKGTVVTGAEGHRLLIGAVSEMGARAKADNITGLRREARFRLNMESALRDNPASVRYLMRIGIDNFKEINEKEGVEAGDEVLRELADCIIKTVDEGVDIYRLVADEFMIVDSGTGGGKEPRAIYRQIQKTIAAMAENKEYSRFYTVSGGVLEEDFSGRTVEELMRFTEFALNEAKRNGRNQMMVFDRAAYDIYLKRLDIRKSLRQDVSHDFRGFEVYYQPIVSAADYKLIGAEALLRWKNEKYGSVSPAVFVPILEESGLIIPVGQHVLWEAAKTCKKWKQYVPGFHINVNLSYVQLYKSDLMRDVERCIQEVGIEPESLVLELTESGYIETSDRIKELFRDLKSRKIDLALDDFGTGYSNMRYLKEIDAKTVKIDRSFVVQALRNEYDYNIISHIIDMVHSLGSVVCMEGIEEKEELSKMMATKPDMIQGYYFGKPAPAGQFEKEFLQPTDSP
ncbi:MAG: bifunctional diguanylate cyclase/phosphodiesterase [Lachnospiraceae bacterium]|nr:bifunctional diguanylate cyclase/phosphodiesterase [Lachnospiraceae bacterium]